MGSPATPDEPSGATESGATDEAATQDDVKRRFREALDRKQGRTSDAAAAGEGGDHAKVHGGAHGPAASSASSGARAAADPSQPGDAVSAQLAGRNGVLAPEGSGQATSPPGCRPARTSSSFARLNGRDPKNPRSADIGLGCALLIRGTSPEQRPQVLRVAAPEDRHQRAAAGDQRPDRGVRDLLPALAAVRRGRAGAHREHPVEQQDALLGPRRQVAVGGGGTPTSAHSSRKMFCRLRGTGRTSGATANDSPTGCPGVG